MRLNHQAPQEAKDHSLTKRDALLQNLATKSPVEINAFVDTEFSQLNATQRKFLKVLALVSVQYIRDKLR